MSILWADNFQMYGTGATAEALVLNGLYADITTTYTDFIADPDPSGTGETVLKMVSDFESTTPYAGATLRFSVPGATKTTLGVSARFYLDSLPVSDGASVRPFVFIDTTGARHVWLMVRSDGRLSIGVGSTQNGNLNTSVLIGTSTLPVITADAWQHVEMKVTVDDTVGATEVRVNGVEVAGLTLTGVDTRNGATPNIGSVAFENYEFVVTGPTIYIKDFIVWDTLGSQNNDFIGSAHVYNLLPDGDSALTWTPSTGSVGYDLVDDSPPDDATYLSADDTLPAANVFTVSDLPPDIISVKALLPVVRVKKIDGGDGNVQAAIISNAATDSGADRPITTAFTYYWDVSEVSPDTAVAYTPTEVNNITFSVDRTV